MADALSVICNIGDVSNLNIAVNTADYHEILRNMSIPFDELFESCSSTLDVLNCSNILSEVITDEGICYSYNMLDAEEIYRDNVVHSSVKRKYERKSSWSLQGGYESDGFKIHYFLFVLY